MEKGRDISLSKEEEEGVTTTAEEISEKEVFQRILAGNLWTNNNFNARPVMSTMVGPWKLKNPVETQ